MHAALNSRQPEALVPPGRARSFTYNYCTCVLCLPSAGSRLPSLGTLVTYLPDTIHVIQGKGYSVLCARRSSPAAALSDARVSAPGHAALDKAIHHQPIVLHKVQSNCHRRTRTGLLPPAQDLVGGGVMAPCRRANPGPIGQVVPSHSPSETPRSSPWPAHVPDTARSCSRYRGPGSAIAMISLVASWGKGWGRHTPKPWPRRFPSLGLGLLRAVGEG